MKPHSSTRLLRDYLVTAAIAVALALFIREFIIEAYRIPSAAMKPALVAGDLIFVSKWSNKLLNNYLPKYGDIIVFEDMSITDTTGPDYVKRVVGLSGDRVEIRKGQLYLNDKKRAFPLPKSHQKIPDKPCIPESLPNKKEYPICFDTQLLPDFGPETVPPDSVFVIGDYRAALPSATPSSELKEGKKNKGWGIIPLSSVKGKASWIWLSIEPHQNFGERTHWYQHLRLDRMLKEIP